MSYLPKPLNDRLGSAVSHRHQFVETSVAGDLLATVQRERTDLVAVDPLQLGGEREILLPLVHGRHHLPFLVYTTPVPSAMQLVADLVARGLPARHILIRGTGDSTPELLDRVEEIAVTRIDSEVRTWLARSLASSPMRVRRGVLALFAEPHRFRRVEDISREEGIARRSLLRAIRDAGLSSVRHLVVAAHVLRAHRYLQSDGVTVELVASKLGHPGVRTLNRYFEKVTGSPPSSWRHRGSDSTLLERLEMLLYASRS